ncbi:hypothetical protein V7S43_007935 [Phytophthora oleae]|uniref:Uncharacterized protein n=1 Tax=Phytophthora oleae TaxID=2107226 RepID=A0ABD3FJ98_9STRA
MTLIDPSIIVQHTTTKLYEMWKIVNGNYMKAFAKFNVSGQHSNAFYDFCSGDLEVAYLRVCINEKPELEPFVKGGMRQEDEIDSLSLSTLPPPPVKVAKWQDQVLQTINRMEDIFVKAPITETAVPSKSDATQKPNEEGVLIDHIAKLHQLIE